MNMKNMIGKRLVNDVYSADGELLVKSFSILNEDHMQLIKQRRIFLSEDDVIEAGPYGQFSHSEQDLLIDEIVAYIKEMFTGIRSSKVIPLAQIRQRIIPMVQHIIGQSNVLSLFAALQPKDDYIYRHSFAVATISALLGKWLKMPDNELLQLTTAAFLHDIGKLQIPQHIWHKPGKLDAEEFELMVSHTSIGYEMIKNTIGTNHRQALAALQHHERMDGTGYPLGLKGEQIDSFARIIAIADVFHAMASKRVYSNSSPFYEILSQIKEDAYAKFDTDIVRIFVERVMWSALGYSAIMTDSSIAKIVHIHPQNPTLPLVQVSDQFFDLSKTNKLQIEQIII